MTGRVTGRRIAVLVCVLAAACTSAGERDYRPGDLAGLVLSEVPEGARARGGGELTLDDVARGEQDRRERFEDAGFVAAFERTFGGAGSGRLGRSGFLLVSRAYLFEDPDAGLAALRAIIETEGESLTEETLPFSDRDGFALAGEIDDNLPPGAVIAWRKGNVVLLVAAVASTPIELAELRALAIGIDTLEPPVG